MGFGRGFRIKVLQTVSFLKTMRICLITDTALKQGDEILQGFTGHSLQQESSIGKAFLYEVDYMAVLVEDEGKAVSTLKRIKSDLNLFLKPLLVLGYKNLEAYKSLSDEQILLPVKASEISNKLDSLNSIAEKFQDFNNNLEDLNEDQQKDICVLRYLSSRDEDFLSPERNTRSKVGYTYPLLRSLYDVAMGEEIDRLEILEETGLIRGSPIDNIHTCPECGLYNINFREVCPDCQSIKINQENTLHHFRCAYVGKEKDFASDHKLICPKCLKRLNHIGVDYDRPTENFWCDSCGLNFSEPQVSCFCLNCTNIFISEEAVHKSIKEYKITRNGYRAAKEGFLTESGWVGVFRKELNLYRYEVFEEILKLEINRCTRYKSHSTLIHFSLRKLETEKTANQLSDYKSLRHDLIRIFQDTFRNTDIATDVSPTDNLVVLTHTDQGSANRAMERLNEKLNLSFKGTIICLFALQELSVFEGDHHLLLNQLQARLDEKLVVEEKVEG